MLNLNASQADALSDALSFAVIWFDDLDSPALTPLRHQCCDLDEKIDNHHTHFSVADIIAMQKAVDVFIDNCDEVEDEHIIVQKLLCSLPASVAVIINYI